MKNIKLINICNIKVDKHPINSSTLSLVDFIRESYQEIKPIKVQQTPNGQYLIKDGRHRVTAFKLLGRDKIEAIVQKPKPLKTFLNDDRKF